MIYTYLLLNAKHSGFYTGISQDPWKRLVAHNRGTLKVTQNGRPWELVYIKSHATYDEARKHEKWLKKKNREYKMHLVAQLAPPVRGAG